MAILAAAVRWKQLCCEASGVRRLSDGSRLPSAGSGTIMLAAGREILCLQAGKYLHLYLQLQYPDIMSGHFLSSQPAS